ncbi:MAG: hypothetical protein EHM57_00230 [Actinobacteria bacterium]|nr:MAG: hypothetical protein EHM57_00230 [Actinomycetota bacterium]
MGSLSVSEIVTIMVIVLIIFGPQRLPELARRLGNLVAKAREATASFARQMESEYGEAAEPIRELRSQIEGARRDITDVVTGIADIDATGTPGARPAEPEQRPAEEAEGGEPPAAGQAP